MREAPRQSVRQISPDVTQLPDQRELATRTELTELPVQPVPAMSRADKKRLERMVAWTTGERLRCLAYRIRLELSDVHYVARRVVELRLNLPQ